MNSTWKSSEMFVAVLWKHRHWCRWCVCLRRPTEWQFTKDHFILGTVIMNVSDCHFVDWEHCKDILLLKAMSLTQSTQALHSPGFLSRACLRNWHNRNINWTKRWGTLVSWLHIQLALPKWWHESLFSHIKLTCQNISGEDESGNITRDPPLWLKRGRWGWGEDSCKLAGTIDYRWWAKDSNDDVHNGE